MPSIFCCSNTQSYKNCTLSHESKFRPFKSWASYPKASNITEDLPSAADATLAVQVVKQTNFGPLDSKRYFVTTGDDAFVEVFEQRLIDANFQKLNTWVF
jgi:hypothetical protein